MSGSLGRRLIGGTLEIPLLGFALLLVRIGWDPLQQFLVMSQFSKVSPATLSANKTSPHLPQKESAGASPSCSQAWDAGSDVWAWIHVAAVAAARPRWARHLQEEEMGSRAQ